MGKKLFVMTIALAIVLFIWPSLIGCEKSDTKSAIDQVTPAAKEAAENTAIGQAVTEAKKNTKALEDKMNDSYKKSMEMVDSEKPDSPSNP